MTYNEKKRLFREYKKFALSSFTLYIDNIPEKQLNNAIKTFGRGCNESSVIALYDTTILHSGKQGYLFTENTICYLETLGKPKKLWLNDIHQIELKGKPNAKDCDKTLIIYLNDGSVLKWYTPLLNKSPMKKLLESLIALTNPVESEKKVKINNSNQRSFSDFATTGSGFAFGTYENVNKQYDEEKFHASQGHGFAAERANNLYDRITGHDAKIIGDDNRINGADRIVDGVKIQSKYYQTGKGCIDDCFDSNGIFRYIDADTGLPMQIEVPSDKYQEAVNAMADKIKEGKIPGITDPAEAENLVRKGHFTYAQARNLAKAGTIESLAYDSITGGIIATTTFGITATITFAVSVWNGDEIDIALKKAAYSGLQVGGTTFIVSVLSSQLSKAGLNSLLVGGSETIVAIMGPKASAVLINAFRFGKPAIHGAAAMKSAAKLLRNNVITGVGTFIVFSTVDVVNIFRGRISGKQLFKNLMSSATTIGGGTVGWTSGASLGAKIGFAIAGPPGAAAGGVLGGLGGAVLGGGAAGKATDTFLGVFIEDDAEEMVRVIEREFIDLAGEYLLNQTEVEKVVDQLQNILTGRMLKDMYASNSRKQYAQEILTPLIESVTVKRKKIYTLTGAQMTYGLKAVLEDISDNSESQIDSAFYEGTGSKENKAIRQDHENRNQAVYVVHYCSGTEWIRGIVEEGSFYVTNKVLLHHRSEDIVELIIDKIRINGTEVKKCSKGDLAWLHFKDYGPITNAAYVSRTVWA